MDAEGPVPPPGLATRAGSPPPAIRAWLAERRPLTGRLRTACPRGIRLRVLAQRWRRPLPEESMALALRAGRWALVREVVMECRGVPWVYARTVIPPAALRGHHRRLARLGSRPLGSVLFARPRFARRFLAAGPLPAARRLHERAVHLLGEGIARDAWYRRTLYACGGRELHVAEVFLAPLATVRPRSSVSG